MKVFCLCCLGKVKLIQQQYMGVILKHKSDDDFIYWHLTMDEDDDECLDALRKEKSSSLFDDTRRIDKEQQSNMSKLSILSNINTENVFPSTLSIIVSIVFFTVHDPISSFTISLLETFRHRWSLFSICVCSVSAKRRVDDPNATLRLLKDSIHSSIIVSSWSPWLEETDPTRRVITSRAISRVVRFASSTWLLTIRSGCCRSSLQ